MATDKDKFISVQGVKKIYYTRVGEVLALDHCSFDMKEGEFIAMAGPSGCGKTTMLNLIAGFDKLTEGKIFVDGKIIAEPGKHLEPGPDRVVVFQLGALFPWKTNLANIMFGPLVRGGKKKEIEEKARELARMTGIESALDMYPSYISSGMQRRVEIVRALMCEPKILLLDEPFRALDAVTKTIMHHYVLNLYDKTKKTIMFITHDIDEAVFLASRVFIMTTRPGHLKQWIDIDLPRPRKVEDKASKEYLQYKQETFELVG
ncbi:MAG: ABC transporter ATP-binding protein, partial [Desulfobacteraceae bacterium]|nr:ABC transporter ATP-binding protein [Desulfobacteraceae bacterium]